MEELSEQPAVAWGLRGEAAPVGDTLRHVAVGEAKGCGAGTNELLALGGWLRTGFVVADRASGEGPLTVGVFRW